MAVVVKTPPPSLTLGAELRNEGKVNRAEAVFKALWETTKGRGPADAALAYGRILLTRGKLKRAEALLGNAARKRGKLRPYAILQLASCLHEEGKNRTAKAWLDHLMAGRTHRGFRRRALRLRALVCRKLGLHGAEAESWKRYLATKPPGSRAEEAWYLWARALEASGRKREALRIYKKVYFKRTGSPFGHAAGMAMLRLAKRSHKKIKPLTVKASLIFAKRCLRGGRLLDAMGVLNSLSKAKVSGEEAEELAYERVACLYALRKNDRTVAEAEAMAIHFGYTKKTASALLKAAWSCVRYGKHKEVLRLADKILACKDAGNDMRREALYVMGVSAYISGRFGEALKTFDRLAGLPLRGKVSKGRVLSMRAWCLFQAGKYRRAGISFTAASSAARSSELGASCRYWAARCFFRSGAKKRAIGAMEKLAVKPAGYWAEEAVTWLAGQKVYAPSLGAHPSAEATPWPLSMHGRRTSLSRRLALCGLDAAAAEELLPWFRRHARERSAALTMAGLYARSGRIGLAESVTKGAFGDALLLVRPPENLLRAVYVALYLKKVKNLCKEEGLAPSLALAVIRRESDFDPGALSRSGARGLMQLMPATAARTAGELKLASPSPKDLLSPDINLRLGIHYLAGLVKRFRKAEGVAAYNAGERAVRTWMKVFRPKDQAQFVAMIPYNETRKYTERVLLDAQRYKTMARLNSRKR